MANDASALRKELRSRGYDVQQDCRRGKARWLVMRAGKVVAAFPVSPSPGSWLANTRAAIARFERTGTVARSARVRPA